MAQDTKVAASPAGKRVVCPSCGCIVKVDMQALKARKADKLGRGSEDIVQKTMPCPNCKSCAYRTLDGKFIGELL